MFFYIVFFVCLLVSNGSIFGQTETNPTYNDQGYTDEINWQRYKITSHDVSANFPKLPVLYERIFACDEVEIETFFAYAGEAVYTLVIASKTKRDFGRCDSIRRFKKDSFEKRIKDLKNETDEAVPQNVRINEKDAVKITGKNTTYVLFNDFENNRWYELWVTERTGESEKAKEFIESVRFGKNPAGIEINVGANQVLGDSSKVKSSQLNSNAATTNSQTQEKANSSQKDNDTLSMILVHKPQARYTDRARFNGVQGTVALKVAFLANGSIGKISVVAGLPDGLTEQALAATRKLCFIPKKYKNENVTVVRTIEYKFSIY